ncbi:hypothetical protein TNCV_3198991 [Trichonephila clavipes]|nr:hypothetical protein TNCV_3198991 [Trichonephila clavipes]
MREKGGKRLVPGTDYMVDELKLPNKEPMLLQSHYRPVWPGSHQRHSRTFMAIGLGLATVSVASPRYDHDRSRRILS